MWSQGCPPGPAAVPRWGVCRMFSGPGHTTRLEQAQRARLGIESQERHRKYDKAHDSCFTVNVGLLYDYRESRKKSLEKPVRNISC